MIIPNYVNMIYTKNSYCKSIIRIPSRYKSNLKVDLTKSKVSNPDLSKPKFIKHKANLMYLPGAINFITVPKINNYINVLNLNIDNFLKLTSVRLREYLMDTKGVFNKSNYSSILVPKSSTKKLPSGVSKDQRRSVMSKISNYFTKNGLNLTSVIHLNKAFVLLNKLSKADTSSDSYARFSLSYDNLSLLNASYRSSNLPIVGNLIEGSVQSIPRFFIKKHKSKLPGRKKNKTKGKPPVRSYLAFIKPHGRSLIGLKWLVSDLGKMPKNVKLHEKYTHLMITNIMKVDSKLYKSKKISIYKSIVDYLKRKGS